MAKRYVKNLISFFVSGIILFCLSITAFADPLSAAITVAIDALGVTIGGIGLTPGLIDTTIGDPTRTDVPITLDGSNIRVTHNYETIDGVQYDRVLFSPEFAEYLNSEGLGWIADNSIDPNSSGTIASGVGSCGGVPIFNINGRYLSQNYTFPIPASPSSGEFAYLTEVVGDWYAWTRAARYTQSGIVFNLTGEQPPSGGVWYNIYASDTFVINCGTPSSTYTNGYWAKSNNLNGVLSPYLPFNYSPFSFDYVSGTIDTGSKDGLNLEVLVPSGYLDDVPDGTIPVSGGTPSNPLTQLNDAILDALSELVDIISEFVEPAPEPTPTPTPVPIPTDALGAVPYPTWMATFGQFVKDGIETINDTVGLFKESVEDFFDTVGQGIQDSLEDMYDLVGLFKDGVLDALDTWGQSIEDAIDDLGTLVNTGITSLRQILEAIRTAVASIPATLTQILEHIKQGHLDLFKGVLDAIKVVFAPILIALKSALRLWHYVVEWVQATAPVFSTFTGFMSGTSYNMVLPIYAALAGPICIAIYKRFGR